MHAFVTCGGRDETTVTEIWSEGESAHIGPVNYRDSDSKKESETASGDTDDPCLDFGRNLGPDS